MSEETRVAPDLSRIVKLIMENPKLIEEISALSGGDSGSPSEEPAASESKTQESVPTYVEPKSPNGRERRAQLLSALKPYLSGERQKAIDSMMTFADIIDSMRGR